MLVKSHLRKQKGALFVGVALGACGMVLGAWYLFTALRRMLFGPMHEPHHAGEAHVEDLSPREWGSLVPLVVLCVVIGFYPAPILNSSKDDVDRIAARTDMARERAGSKAAVIVAVGDKR